ncbi:hypothetical protein ACQ4PT_062435 [Festuca glaucescens]
MRMGGRADTPRKRGAGLEERADPCERTVSPLALEHTSPFHWIFDPILFRLTLVRLSEGFVSTARGWERTSGRRDESRGLEWHMRYEIIKGVCRGLHHLHAECHIVHLDLKPENILLDDNMKPKIADFGMSRLFGEQQSRIITGSRGGTFGYMAPEYLTNGLISTKSDIFSLGVMIIELMTGHRDYPQSSGTPSDHFIEKVLGNWRHRLEKTSRYSLLEIYCQQVKNCIMAGVNGVDPDPKRRPSAWDIIQTLNETEGQDSCFGKNEGTAMGQKSQTGTSSGSFSTNSNNSVTDFDRILSTTNKSRTRNISAMFRFAPKGAMISILSFEIANTIVKAYNLMKLLSKQEMRHLKEGVLRSEGVHHLISEDYSQLLLLVENDIREEFRRISVEVCRFGNLCIDHRWHRLDRYLSRLEYEVAPQKNFEELALSNMKCLINYVQATLILRQELQTLDRVEQEFCRQFTMDFPLDEGTLSAKSQVAKKQRAHVKNWKKKSLWSKKMEDVMRDYQSNHLFHPGHGRCNATGGGAASVGHGGRSTPPSPSPTANMGDTAAAPVPPGSGLVDPSSVSGGADVTTHARQRGTVAPPGPGAATPSRRSTRHDVGLDGAAASDEDSLAKAMRRKAAANLDFAGCRETCRHRSFYASGDQQRFLEEPWSSICKGRKEPWANTRIQWTFIALRQCHFADKNFGISPFPFIKILISCKITLVY